MERFEHLTIEWYWTAAAGTDPSAFQPHFRIFRPDGNDTVHPGYSREVTQALCALGREGYEVVGCIGVSNWILWTLKRRLAH